jgi:hypothetical protein
MIGGKVLEVVGLPSGARDSLATHRVWVVGTGCEQHDERAVHVHNDQDVRLPIVGEGIWWGQGRVFYGGHDPKHGEVSMRKVGGAYDPHKVINRCPL